MRGNFRFNFIILVLFFASIKGLVAAEEANPDDVQSCSSFLGQFVPGPHFEAPNRIVQFPWGRPKASGPVKIGERGFFARWTIEEAADPLKTHLRLGFEAQNGDQMAVLVYPKTSERDRFLIKLDLDRTNEHSYLGLNLFSEALTFLHRFASIDDEFEILVEDPTLVSALNNAYEESLNRLNYAGDFPRRAVYGESHPLDKFYEYDPDTDSYFPHMSASEKIALDKTLLAEFGLQEARNRVLLAHKMGLAIHRGSAWMVKIETIQRVVSILKAAEEGEERPNPYIFRYRLVLSPNF